MEKVRRVLAALIIVFCLWLLLPLAAGILHIGMIYPLILLIPPLVLLLKPALWRWVKARKVLLALLFVVCGGGLVFCSGTMIAMAAAAEHDADGDVTVVVLGCKVHGERPSRMLYDRCEVALAYLKDHPDAVCVATGGQGRRENISEAEAIFNVLTAGGIAPERIYLEDRSTDTAENLRFTAAVIDGAGLPADVAIATDGFHQLRAGIYAKRAGLTPYGLPSATYIFVLPGYWFREVLAVWEALVLA